RLRAGVDRRGADQTPRALLLEDVRAPAGRAGRGEHRGEHVRRDLRVVEDDRGPELDVRLEHAVGTTLLELLECGLLERDGDLGAGSVELLRRATQRAGAGILRAIDAVTEAHEALTRVELL